MKANNNTKVGIGIGLLVTLLIALATGIILHLKKHGVVIEPRPVIKMIHWIAGAAMIVLLGFHIGIYSRMLTAMRNKFRWFWLDTWALGIVTAVVAITGFVKLLSPVKIPHLGMWHYWLGLAMGVLAIIHLFRAIPAIKRKVSARK